MTNDEKRLLELSNQRLLPISHRTYLMSISRYFKPKVIYDIGACVLHWTHEAEQIWKDSKFILFEAMPESESLFKKSKHEYTIGVLSDKDDKQVEFYQNTYHPGGNSYYKENKDVNPEAELFFNETHKRIVKTKTLDTIVQEKKYPYPELIKMDVQGAEMDIIKGASRCLDHCMHLILELQKVEYNKNAPLRGHVISYLRSKGFGLVTGPFSDNGPDGDYHFIKIY